MNECTVRSETSRDYADISDVHAATFDYGYGVGEAALVNMLRSRETFDPDLSLLAGSDGKTVGHVLFTPQRLLLGGSMLNAVLLGPVAVLAGFQNRGIGSKLIAEGHKRAMEKGFQLSILLGHPGYYRRFGYQPYMWSDSGIRIPRRELPALTGSVAERRIRVGDLERLNALWSQWNQGAGPALQPDASLAGWISPGQNIRTSIIEMDGHFAGYMRYDMRNPAKILNILAKDGDSLVALCAYASGQLAADAGEYLYLPISSEACQRHQVPVEYRAEDQSSPAKMLKIFDYDSPASDYCKAVVLGERSPGHLIWPVEFDVC